MIRRLLLGLTLLCLAGPAAADRILPAYLEVIEHDPQTYAVLWKSPTYGGQELNLEPRFPPKCKRHGKGQSRAVRGALLQRWYLRCPGGLAGERVVLEGLAETRTDVLLRWSWLDGSASSIRLTPRTPTATLPARSSPIAVARTYLLLGIEHILRGVDHLLFVLALVLIVRDRRSLLLTITAFTLAHSLTLGAATLGIVRVPQRAVEAVIALSILCLALEVAHGRQGRPGAATRRPWVVAFLFGLLHGFGFAGALTAVGLPQGAIPLALLFFNLGVEAGQLLFVIGVLRIGQNRLRIVRPGLARWGEMMVVYGIGGLASFWLLDRVASF
ncbi:MAG: HupE/UreJ family protein [Myxococcota bacterium]